jgi:macrophage erythroblast attacher
MYGGLSALKLTACYDHDTKNVDCPVCDLVGGYESGLGQLASEVPRSNHMNSTIVCNITGKIMDQDNMPLSFPNGYVYSKEARFLNIPLACT